MKRLVPYVAVIALAAAAAGCNKGVGSTAYNNSGASATPGSSTTTTTTSTTASTDTAAPTNSTVASSGSDTSSSSPTSGNAVTDTVTTGKVKAAFATDPNLKDSDIAVKTDGGVVVLSGTVKSQDQVAMATNLAQRQEGVNRVDNQVVVR